jgi:hypothetical protein
MKNWRKCQLLVAITLVAVSASASSASAVGRSFSSGTPSLGKIVLNAGAMNAGALGMSGKLRAINRALPFTHMKGPLVFSDLARPKGANYLN